jgi:hypothetical protein
MHTTNFWEEITDTQCEAASGGVLFLGVSSPYFSATFTSDFGLAGTVANFDAPGVAYTPGSPTPTVIAVTGDGNPLFIPFN